jgi:hypothetical protein
MLSQRRVALRVNGLRVMKAMVRRGKRGPELVIRDPLLGDFALDEGFTLELLELVIPPEMRQRLPNGGWRRVSLRILIALVRDPSILFCCTRQGRGSNTQAFRSAALASRQT